MTRCRSCGKEIVFARMATSGKSAPFERDEAGEWIVVDGVASHQGKAPENQPTESTVPRWTSHFARCAQAASWRKR